MKKYLFVTAIALFPYLVHAQVGDIQNLIVTITDILYMLIPIVAGIALLVFFYGLAKFVLKVGDGADLQQGRALMLWGIIGLFFMFAVWGIVEFVGDAFGIQQGGVL
jgi:hypothetical protein